MTLIRRPEECTTMAEVRAAIDHLDRQVVALLARRFGYMDAAARIKPDIASVRDDARKAEVLGNVRAEGLARGLDGELLAELYDRLIEQSISYETAAFEKLRS